MTDQLPSAAFCYSQYPIGRLVTYSLINSTICHCTRPASQKQLPAQKAPFEYVRFEELGTTTPDSTGGKFGEYIEDTNLLFTYAECYVRR